MAITITRREQLKLLLLGASAPLVYGAGAAGRRFGVFTESRGKAAVIRRYNPLGKTGLKVSDVGCGVSTSVDPAILVDAWRRGINYFDISPLFTWSVEMLAEAFSRDADMKKNAIVAGKVECMNIFNTMQCLGGVENKGPLDVCIGCIDETLRKLGRDRIDIMQIHGVGQGGPADLEFLDPHSIKGQGAAMLFDTLKSQGKIRFSGISTHGPKLLNEAVAGAVASGTFDTLMPALNFMQGHSPPLGDSLAHAGRRGVGVTAMKTLANAKNSGVRTGDGRPFSHAAIAWALSRPGVSNLVITVDNKANLDEYIAASGRELSSADRAALDMHTAMTSTSYCRAGCGQCAGACPDGIDVPTALRIDQYRTIYKSDEMAEAHHAAAGGNSRLDACIGCEAPACEGACPFGLKVRERMVAAWQHIEGATASYPA